MIQLLLKERRNLFIETGELEKAIVDQEQLFELDTSNLSYRYDLADLYFDLLSIKLYLYFK